MQTLKKMPEKMTRSPQRSVTWQASSEYRRLAVPNDRTQNCVSFARKIQIPKIFGSPLVYVKYNGGVNVHLCDKVFAELQ